MSGYVFFGLDPRGVKKRLIEAALTGQKIVWLRVIGLRLRNYKETVDRAEDASVCNTTGQELSLRR
jgi:hypothetical protein